MKIICVPMGSAGDVHPLVWLGRLMASRGHEVVVVAQAMAAELARRSGLRVVVSGDIAEQESLLRNPDLWDPQKAFFLLAKYMPQFAVEMVSVIEKEAVPGETVILAGTLAFAAQVVGEKLNVPVLGVHLQPTVMMSVEDMPLMMARGEFLLRMPRWLKRAFFGLVNWRVGGALGRPLEAMRREAGLPPRHLRRGEIMNAWWHGNDAELCLFPQWYAGKASDWPAESMVTRFPLYDESGEMAMDENLERFLAAGDAPVVITPGSANAQAEAFLKTAAEACVRLGVRGVVVTRFPEQVPEVVKQRPDLLAAFEYVPFGRLFKRAKVVVHHGGIGTMAQCLAAGVPQLIMPMSHDQPDNAYRCRRFGLAEYLYPGQFQVEKVAGALGRVIASAEVANACGTYQEKMSGQMTADEMATVVESLAGRALKTRGAARGAGRGAESLVAQAK